MQPSTSDNLARPGTSQLSGRVLIWHGWTGAQASLLDEILDTFSTEIQPNVVIERQSFADMEQMRTQFQAAAKGGLGPDLMIAPSDWVRPLAEDGYILDIGANEAIDSAVLEQFMPSAVQTLLYENRLYGLPTSVETMVLYTNQRLVNEQMKGAATTLDALLQQAYSGHVIALNTTFDRAFWGIQAFGGDLFDTTDTDITVLNVDALTSVMTRTAQVIGAIDTTAGDSVTRQVILEKGGFANWLDWLEEARETPGMILDTDQDSLRSRFLEGSVDYYIGSTAEYQRLRDALIENSGDTIGVSTLPRGPVGNAGPFLRTQAILFNSASSNNQTQIALKLAQFITNAEQSSILMRQVQYVPANNRVRVNPRLHPIVASFVAQARTAVPLLNIPEMDAVFALGDDAYVSVLEGLAQPAEAAFATTQAINTTNGFDMSESQAASCTQVGTIELLNSWVDEQQHALQMILQRFRRECPGIIVKPTFVEESELWTYLQGGNPDDNVTSITDYHPHLIIAPHIWLETLIQQDRIANISSLVDAEILQRYRPLTVDALRNQPGHQPRHQPVDNVQTSTNNSLYGLPISLELAALYYNKGLVAEPARTLDDLLTQQSENIPIVLDSRFGVAFWGIGTGGLSEEESVLEPATPVDSGNFAQLEPTLFAAWLRWLQDAQNRVGVALLDNEDELRQRFLLSESAYYVDTSAAIKAIYASRTPETIGVTSLPSGSLGDATPLATVTALYVAAHIPDFQMQLALQFAQFMTDTESQLVLMNTAQVVPANSALDTSGTDGDENVAIAAFVEQAKSAKLTPDMSTYALMQQYGTDAYVAVLQGGTPPEEAATAAVTALVEAQAVQEADVVE
ncbi:MAG: extracellular solute-binding protein [Chloroflexota bacterium]